MFLAPKVSIFAVKQCPREFCDVLIHVLPWQVAELQQMIKERDAEIENYEEILKGSMADQESGWVGKVAKDGFSLSGFVEFVCVP